MDLNSTIRQLAKTNKYQTLYSHVKEGGLQLFENTSNYTDTQVMFLNYLSFYYILYSDIAMDYVDEIVLNDLVYEDAYFYYKKKSKGKDIGENNSTQENKKNTKDKTITNRTTWLFKKRKK